ncbi:hypothetical protein [Pedobacter hartonius]|uniref:DUF4397 domain-containing protein n=1 Tax=Pedobacter hartonius TaxID=425514 RepID=A0A1H4HL10_9SPHI|nr:hypothetical protein [Pedobacter hartonius]SEB21728.1 hypothetical protein SAMN05443550_12121 [Pedobacter hartonius]
MKKILPSLMSAILLFSICSCEKEKDDIKGTANINVINAAIGAGSIKVNPGAGNGFAYSKTADLAYGANAMYGAFTGSNTIKVVSSTDTTKTLFSRTIDLQPISTLYIAGQSPAIDTIFRVEKNLPYIQATVKRL